MPTLQDVAELFPAGINKAEIDTHVWPPGDLIDNGTLSLRKLIDRFGDAGAELRAFRQSTSPSKWAAADRSLAYTGMKERVLDPAVVRQLNAQLCGPLAIAFLFAMRTPAQYVHFIAELFHTGQATCVSGRIIKPSDDLLEGDYPDPSETGKTPINQTDWLFGTALRDDENWALDAGGNGIIGSGGIPGVRGLAGLTTAFEMRDWVKDILGCWPELLPEMDVSDYSTINGAIFGPFAMTGEIELLRSAAQHVALGGIACLAIDSELIAPDGDLVSKNSKDDPDDTRHSYIVHLPGSRALATEPRYSDVDVWPWPNHWVVMLGDFAESGDRIGFRIWSWGAEFSLSGSADDIGEYIYTAATGVRRYDG